jgi:hypothetical protein
MRKTPDPELPEDQQPFNEREDIAYCGVAVMDYFDREPTHQFRDKAHHQQDEKGPIALTDAAYVYQPGNEGN